MVVKIDSKVNEIILLLIINQIIQVLCKYVQIFKVQNKTVLIVRDGQFLYATKKKISIEKIF